MSEGTAAEEVPIQVSVRYLSRDTRQYVAILTECPECLATVREPRLAEHLAICREGSPR